MTAPLDPAALPGPAPAAPSGGPSARSPAAPGEFRALLERLAGRARDLEHAARVVRDPDDLAGAVASAGSSLRDALALGDRLLEAYRRASIDGPAARAGGDGTGGDGSAA